MGDIFDTEADVLVPDAQLRDAGSSSAASNEPLLSSSAAGQPTSTPVGLQQRSIEQQIRQLNLASCALLNGDDVVAADTKLHHALELLRRHSDALPRPVFHVLAATTLNNQGILTLRKSTAQLQDEGEGNGYIAALGQFHEASSHETAALAMQAGVVSNSNAAQTALNIGVVLSKLGRHDQSAVYAQAAIGGLLGLGRGGGGGAPNASAAPALQSPPPRLDSRSKVLLCISLYNLGAEYEHLQQYALAKQVYGKGLALAKACTGTGDLVSSLADAYDAVCKALAMHGSDGEAGQQQQSPSSPVEPSSAVAASRDLGPLMAHGIDPRQSMMPMMDTQVMGGVKDTTTALLVGALWPADPEAQLNPASLLPGISEPAARNGESIVRRQSRSSSSSSSAAAAARPATSKGRATRRSDTGRDTRSASSRRSTAGTGFIWPKALAGVASGPQNPISDGGPSPVDEQPAQSQQAAQQQQLRAAPTVNARSGGVSNGSVTLHLEALALADAVAPLDDFGITDQLHHEHPGRTARCSQSRTARRSASPRACETAGSHAHGDGHRHHQRLADPVENLRISRLALSATFTRPASSADGTTRGSRRAGSISRTRPATSNSSDRAHRQGGYGKLHAGVSQQQRRRHEQLPVVAALDTAQRSTCPPFSVGNGYASSVEGGVGARSATADRNDTAAGQSRSANGLVAGCENGNNGNGGGIAYDAVGSKLHASTSNSSIFNHFPADTRTEHGLAPVTSMRGGQPQQHDNGSRYDEGELKFEDDGDDDGPVSAGGDNHSGARAASSEGARQQQQQEYDALRTPSPVVPANRGLQSLYANANNNNNSSAYASYPSTVFHDYSSTATAAHQLPSQPVLVPVSPQQRSDQFQLHRHHQHQQQQQQPRTASREGRLDGDVYASLRRGAKMSGDGASTAGGGSGRPATRGSRRDRRAARPASTDRPAWDVRTSTIENNVTALRNDMLRMSLNYKPISSPLEDSRRRLDRWSRSRSPADLKQQQQQQHRPTSAPNGSSRSPSLQPGSRTSSRPGSASARNGHVYTFDVVQAAAAVGLSSTRLSTVPGSATLSAHKGVPASSSSQRSSSDLTAAAYNSRVHLPPESKAAPPLPLQHGDSKKSLSSLGSATNGKPGGVPRLQKMSTASSGHGPGGGGRSSRSIGAASHAGDARPGSGGTRPGSGRTSLHSAGAMSTLHHHHNHPHGAGVSSPPPSSSFLRYPALTDPIRNATPFTASLSSMSSMLERAIARYDHVASSHGGAGAEAAAAAATAVYAPHLLHAQQHGHGGAGAITRHDSGTFKGSHAAGAADAITRAGDGASAGTAFTIRPLPCHNSLPSSVACSALASPARDLAPPSTGLGGTISPNYSQVSPGTAGDGVTQQQHQYTPGGISSPADISARLQARISEALSRVSGEMMRSLSASPILNLQPDFNASGGGGGGVNAGYEPKFSPPRSVSSLSAGGSFASLPGTGATAAGPGPGFPSPISGPRTHPMAQRSPCSPPIPTAYTMQSITAASATATTAFNDASSGVGGGGRGPSMPASATGLLHGSAAPSAAGSRLASGDVARGMQPQRPEAASASPAVVTATSAGAQPPVNATASYHLHSAELIFHAPQPLLPSTQQEKTGSDATAAAGRASGQPRHLSLQPRAPQQPVSLLDHGEQSGTAESIVESSAAAVEMPNRVSADAAGYTDAGPVSPSEDSGRVATITISGTGKVEHEPEEKTEAAAEALSSIDRAEAGLVPDALLPVRGVAITADTAGGTMVHAAAAAATDDGTDGANAYADDGWSTPPPPPAQQHEGLVEAAVDVTEADATAPSLPPTLVELEGSVIDGAAAIVFVDDETVAEAAAMVPEVVEDASVLYTPTSPPPQAGAVASITIDERGGVVQASAAAPKSPRLHDQDADVATPAADDLLELAAPEGPATTAGERDAGASDIDS